MTTEYHNKPAPAAQPAARRTSKGAPPPVPRGPFGYDVSPAHVDAPTVAYDRVHSSTAATCNLYGSSSV